MNCYLFSIVICTVSILANPLPDEEVAIQPNASTKAELFDKNVNINPISPLPPKTVDAVRQAIAKPNATAPPRVLITSIEGAVQTQKQSHAYANAEINLSVPDVETAPTIPEKTKGEMRKKFEKSEIRIPQIYEHLAKPPKTIPIIEAVRISA